MCPLPSSNLADMPQNLSLWLEGGGGGVSLPNLPRQPLLTWHMTCSTLLTLIRRVTVRSDCRCRLSMCVRVCGCACVWWVGGGAIKLRKKKMHNPKISLLLALCHNISEHTPPDIKTGSSRVHVRGHAPSPPRHQADDMSSPVRETSTAPYFLVLSVRSQRPPAGPTPL